MIIDLSGKKAVVSASTAGIGLAIAKGLAATGAEVVINGRSPESVERALSAIRRNDAAADVTGFVGDLATPQMCEQLLAEYPACDILVNCLGIYALRDFFDIDDAEWERFFQANLMSGVRLARGYLPGMMKKSWGRVVFISSESALNIPPEMIHYGFTKTAQLAISRGLAKRVAGTGDHALGETTDQRVYFSSTFVGGRLRKRYEVASFTHIRLTVNLSFQF